MVLQLYTRFNNLFTALHRLAILCLFYRNGDAKGSERQRDGWIENCIQFHLNESKSRSTASTTHTHTHAPKLKIAHRRYTICISSVAQAVNHKLNSVYINITNDGLIWNCKMLVAAALREFARPRFARRFWLDSTVHEMKIVDSQTNEQTNERTGKRNSVIIIINIFLFPKILLKSVNL